jgi:hypothetical protein
MKERKTNLQTDSVLLPYRDGPHVHGCRPLWWWGIFVQGLVKFYPTLAGMMNGLLGHIKDILHNIFHWIAALLVLIAKCIYWVLFFSVQYILFTFQILLMLLELLVLHDSMNRRP